MNCGCGATLCAAAMHRVHQPRSARRHRAPSNSAAAGTGQPSGPISIRGLCPRSAFVFSTWHGPHSPCLLLSSFASSTPPLVKATMWSTSVAMVTMPLAWHMAHSGLALSRPGSDLHPLPASDAFDSHASPLLLGTRPRAADPASSSESARRRNRAQGVANPTTSVNALYASCARGRRC
jgi:hypothetical protein